jgi:hypothetical protein
MKRFMSNIPALQLRQTIATALLGIIFLASTVFCSYVPAAIAKPLTPEAKSYQVDAAQKDAQTESGYFQLGSTESARADDKVQQSGSARPDGKAAIANQRNTTNPQGQRSNDLAGNAKDNLQDNTKSAADNVREKLNLDQPLYPGTKDFANTVKDRVETAIDNTKDAFGGIADDAKDTVNDSFEKVH